MGNDLSIFQGKKTVIEETADSKKILKVKSDTTSFRHAEFIEVPREFKNLSTDEKKEALQAMESDKMSRIEMSSYTGLSSSRISQLIGKKRKPKNTDKILYVQFEPKTFEEKNNE